MKISPSDKPSLIQMLSLILSRSCFIGKSPHSITKSIVSDHTVAGSPWYWSSGGQYSSVPRGKRCLLIAFWFELNDYHAINNLMLIFNFVKSYHQRICNLLYLHCIWSWSIWLWGLIRRFSSLISRWSTPRWQHVWAANIACRIMNRANSSSMHTIWRRTNQLTSSQDTGCSRTIM